MNCPRVLLLEDDASIRGFVALALSEMRIELIQATTIAQARAALESGGVALLIADVMLPDGSGMDLLAELHADSKSHLAMRTVVFSARISADLRARASQIGAWSLLEKPVSFMTLLDCVQRALIRDESAALPPVVDTSPTVGTALHIDADQRKRAIDSHFGGQSALFDAFMVGCIEQLPENLNTGDRACATSDIEALRRVAHNLHSVLQMIGAEVGSSAAQELELSCMRGDFAQILEVQWNELRAQVSDICRRASVVDARSPF